MKKLAIAVLFCCIALSALAQRGLEAIPSDADLERYPLSNHVLSAREQANLNLRPMLLDHSWTGYNWYRGKQRFVLETLPVGTLVLVDTNNAPVYKSDCGNRLVSLPICKDCVMRLATNLPPDQNSYGFLDRFGDFVKNLWRGILNLFGLLLGLAFLLAVMYVLYRFFQWLFEPREERAIPSPVPQTPSRTPSRGSVAPEAASTVSMPTPPAKPPRKFVTCYPGNSMMDQTKIRFSGCKEAFVEQTMEGDDLVTTIRIR